MTMEVEGVDRRLWDLEFSLEVSARYHEWRRATLGRYVTGVRLVTLCGAVLALIFWFAHGAESVPIAFANALIAIVALIDLVFGFDSYARRHNSLFERFKTMQEKVARGRANWPQHIDEWAGDIQAIRRDEPPVFWAIYAMSWNQAIDRFAADRNRLRRITIYQRLVGFIVAFKPKDFPLEAETACAIAA